MAIQIQKARRQQRPAKICIAAPSGAGKTMTSLAIARGIVGESGKILLIDTENFSSANYADEYDFDVANLTTYEVRTLIEVLEAGHQYDAVIVDSLTHFWNKILEEKEKIDARGGNSFTNWAKMTPVYNALIQAIANYPKHLICTMRAKTAYEIEKGENGKSTPKKVGLAAVFRDGAEYEFDVYGRMDLDHNFVVEKSRIPFLADQVINKPDASIGRKIGEWLAGGEPVKAVKKQPERTQSVNISNIDAVLLDYAVKTQCTFAGKTITEVIKAPTGIKWIEAAMNDDAKRARLDAEDVVVFGQVLEAVHEV